jgi:flagellar biosynthesis/type III secretory pathway chaperone
MTKEKKILDLQSYRFKREILDVFNCQSILEYLEKLLGWLLALETMSDEELKNEDMIVQFEDSDDFAQYFQSIIEDYNNPCNEHEEIEKKIINQAFPNYVSRINALEARINKVLYNK